MKWIIGILLIPAYVGVASLILGMTILAIAAVVGIYYVCEELFG